VIGLGSKRWANLQAGISFVVETTLSSKQPLETIRKAKDCGFHVNVIYVALNEPEKNTLRVAERVILGGHDVPDEDLADDTIAVSLMLPKHCVSRMRPLCMTIPACGTRKCWNFVMVLLPGTFLKNQSGYRKFIKR
jgi:hypothetical protein